ncbi:hypothetical protein, partial [Bacillus sp. JJ675]|uniref:hypothetical protein n=1 Tax=Bacillus sp. JJ675 TaxID=3122972 RepID=UPI002FFE811B
MQRIDEYILHKGTFFYNCFLIRIVFICVADQNRFGEGGSLICQSNLRIRRSSAKKKQPATC